MTYFGSFWVNADRVEEAEQWIYDNLRPVGTTFVWRDTRRLLVVPHTDAALFVVSSGVGDRFGWTLDPCGAAYFVGNFGHSEALITELELFRELIERSEMSRDIDVIDEHVIELAVTESDLNRRFAVALQATPVG